MTLGIYLAGPTSLHFEKVHRDRAAFDQAAAFWREIGHTVLNPVEGEDETRWTARRWQNRVQRGLSMVLAADAICVLPGWEQSQSAYLEHDVALAVGKTIYWWHRDGYLMASAFDDDGTQERPGRVDSPAPSLASPEARENAGEAPGDTAHPRARLAVQRLRPDARLPSKSHHDDAGFDLYCTEDMIVPGLEFRDLPCGIAIEVPTGYWSLITGRSSTFRRRGLLVVEGIVDTGFRGEIFVGVINIGSEPVAVQAGERLGQLLIFHHGGLGWPVVDVERLSTSIRGESGFGSTGR